MSIIRAPRPESNFYLLNKSISEDGRLSWGARGVLIFLLGKPDHWQVSIAHLRNATKDCDKPTGRDGVYALLAELIKAGYVRRTQDRAIGGKMGETHYVVSEIACSDPLPPAPLPAKPDPVEPDTANPTLVSIESEQGLKVPAMTESADASRKTRFDPLTAQPSNVSTDTWADWCQYRREIRKPLTAKMCEQQGKALAGHPAPDEVLRQSIGNGWTGIFPDKVTAAPAPSRHHGFAERDYIGDMTPREDGSYAF